jgi:DMSO/TMAO reductase YedYZ molybdopterin-dependent catalytic subunit
MSKISRRVLLTASGLAAGVGAVGLGTKFAEHHSLIPPDSGVLYGAGETLTYAVQRLLTRQSLAREFSRGQISHKPFANEVAPLGEDFKRLENGKFNEWQLTVDGMVAKPRSFSIVELKGLPQVSQITHLACEEGWSYIAEWIGTPLSHVLQAAEVLPQARYVVYRSFQPGWWESVDMADALHPQTFVTYGMNGDDLPVKFGGPLRLRVPRQLGYKSVKFINRITVTDSLKRFGKGVGSSAPEGGYAWYAGI